eukprot:s3207_g2.t1
MQFTVALMSAQAFAKLNWRARDQNELADSLTNQDFSGVDPAKRLECTWGQFDWSLLELLWSERALYLDKDTLRSLSQPADIVGNYEKSAW